jgi:hypothetical protein
MQQINKLKKLSISMFIGLVILLLLSAKPLWAYWFAQNTYGQVIEYKIERQRPANYNVSQITPQRHEILIEYSVKNQDYWISVNSHVYSAIGLIETGDKLLLSYTEENPEHPYVLNYALFSVLASILTPLVLLILLIIFPQWFYHYREANK